MRKIMPRIRKVRQSNLDPVIYSIYVGAKEEPLSDTTTKLIGALKVKYKNTTFYGETDASGMQIKIQLNEYGGQLIPITEPTLECVRKFADEAFKKL